MNENIRKLLEKVEADKELQARFSKIRDPDEAYRLASSIQSGFTQDEFVTEMKKMYEELTKDLSEEEIAKVAGGVPDWVPGVTAATGIAVSTIAISVATSV